MSTCLLSNELCTGVIYDYLNIINPNLNQHQMNDILTGWSDLKADNNNGEIN